MELAQGLEFAKTTRNGVLTTIKRDGRPQLSNIIYNVGGDGVVRISITADRAKYHNLRRDPRASIYIPGENFWAYAVLEGDVTLSPVAGAVDDVTVEELVDLYKHLSGGDHPNWDEYRESMVKDHRTVVHFTPTHAYGMIGR